MSDSEKRVAETLGLSLQEIRRIRAGLQKDVDWFMEDRRVVYSDAGIERVMESLGIRGGAISEKMQPPPPVVEPGVVADALDGSGDGSEAGRPLELVCMVIRICPNPTWVEAGYEDERGVRQRAVVRVKNNRYLRVGAVVRAVKHPGPMGEQGRWLMIGGK